MRMYFIAIVLPDDLNNEIKRYKTLMWERFGSKVGLKSPAHITIIPPFRMEPQKEAGLLKDISHLAAGFSKFLVSTQNFAAFKTRTIFIDVAANEDLKNVKKETDHFFKIHHDYKIKTERRPFHPHITIATRDIDTTAFHEAWELFKAEEFKTDFTAASLSVLQHNGAAWDVIHDAPFT